MPNHYHLLLQAPRAYLSAVRNGSRRGGRRAVIGLRVRLGGERMTAATVDYGYRYDSGALRLVERLEERA